MSILLVFLNLLLLLLLLYSFGKTNLLYFLVLSFSLLLCFCFLYFQNLLFATYYWFRSLVVKQFRIHTTNILSLSYCLWWSNSFWFCILSLIQSRSKSLSAWGLCHLLVKVLIIVVVVFRNSLWFLLAV
jgi:hypothetical protein